MVTRRWVPAVVAATLCLAVAAAENSVLNPALRPTGEPEAAAEADASEPTESDGPAYPVSRFVLDYLQANPGHPPIETFTDVLVTLLETDEGLVAPREGPAITRTLKQLNTGEPRVFYASALQAVIEAVRDRLVGHDLLGVYVLPDRGQIDRTGQDLRPDGQTELRLVIMTGTASTVRTVAFGDRIGPDAQPIDHPLHTRIAAGSPVQPFDAGDPNRVNLIRKDQIDGYALLLSRHPGRRVDVAVSPAAEPGGVTLDYLITETKPWLVYAQLLNTGTRNVSSLREQFGFRHHNLTNNDDVLTIDYVTSGFDQSHAFFAEYAARLGGNDRLRWRVFGGWARYTATDVGIFDDTFKGESYSIGGEVWANVFQSGALFVDVGAGARFEHLEVSDTLPAGTPGDEDLLTPFLTLRGEHRTEWHAFEAAAFLELFTSDATGADPASLALLGRAAVDGDWTILRFDASESVYIEPLLNFAAWADPTTADTSTLAHEIFFQVRGQHAFGDRVVPQYESVVGGLYTVRGYEEAVASGDSAVVLTAEYRYHLARGLPLEPEPGKLLGRTFRYAPQHVYGPADWDLILRGFVDAAWVQANSGGGAPSDSESLLGAGVGLELQYKRNLMARVDWGFALDEVDPFADEGDSRVHFVVTLLF